MGDSRKPVSSRSPEDQNLRRIGIYRDPGRVQLRPAKLSGITETDDDISGSSKIGLKIPKIDVDAVLRKFTLTTMADEKKDSPELANLREREKVLKEKIERLNKLDAKHQLLQEGIEVSEVKRRAEHQLAEVRKAIEAAK